MARGTTLVRLIDQLRAETRASLNPAHNTQARDTQINILQRTQERLWDDFNWPHMRIERQIPVQTGQRYYDTPADMLIDRIERIELFIDGFWRVLSPGIFGPDYGAWNSDLNERSWPPRRWQISENEDIEIWPIADQNADNTTREGYLKFIGIRGLKPLVKDSDRADLDDRLIVLYAAAEMLGAAGAKDAKLKLDQANAVYAKKRSDLTPRRGFKMFGGSDTGFLSHRFVTRYRPPGT